MKRRVLFLALAAAVAALPTLAQDPLDPPYTNFTHSTFWSSCSELQEACAGATPEEILEAAKRNPSLIGTCYAHDDRDGSGYPYAAHHYIKQSWRSGAKGYDGGTGAVGWPNPPQDFDLSAALAGQILQDLCKSGKCCCPVLPAKVCPNGQQLVAYDPRSGTCCTFPNPCTVPADWSPVIHPTDRRCG